MFVKSMLQEIARAGLSLVLARAASPQARKAILYGSRVESDSRGEELRVVVVGIVCCVAQHDFIGEDIGPKRRQDGVQRLPIDILEQRLEVRRRDKNAQRLAEGAARNRTGKRRQRQDAAELEFLGAPLPKPDAQFEFRPIFRL